MLYEAMISNGPGGMQSRFITVEATGVKKAYALAQEKLEEGEVLRGVTPLEESAEKRPTRLRG